MTIEETPRETPPATSQPPAAAASLEGGVGVEGGESGKIDSPPHTPAPEPAQAATPPLDRILALARAQFGDQRLQDWIIAHPGQPFPLVWVGKPDGTYHLHWLTRAERRTLPASRRGREDAEKKLVLP